MARKLCLLVVVLLLGAQYPAAAQPLLMTTAGPGEYAVLETDAWLWLDGGSQVLWDVPQLLWEQRIDGCQWKPLIGVSGAPQAYWRQLELRWQVPWMPAGGHRLPLNINWKGSGALAVIGRDGRTAVLVWGDGVFRESAGGNELEPFRWYDLNFGDELLFCGEPIWPQLDEDGLPEPAAGTLPRDGWHWDHPDLPLRPGQTARLRLHFPAEAAGERVYLAWGGGWELVDIADADGTIVSVPDRRSAAAFTVPSGSRWVIMTLQVINHPDGALGWITAAAGDQSARLQLPIEQPLHGPGLSTGGYADLGWSGLYPHAGYDGLTWAWWEPWVWHEGSGSRGSFPVSNYWSWSSSEFVLKFASDLYNAEFSSGDPAGRGQFSTPSWSIRWQQDDWSLSLRPSKLSEQWDWGAWQWQVFGDRWSGRFQQSAEQYWNIQGGSSRTLTVDSVQLQQGPLRLQLSPAGADWSLHNADGPLYLGGRITTTGMSVRADPKPGQSWKFYWQPAEPGVQFRQTAEDAEFALGLQFRETTGPSLRLDVRRPSWLGSLYLDNFVYHGTLQFWQEAAVGNLAGHLSVYVRDSTAAAFSRIRWQASAGRWTLRLGVDISAGLDYSYWDGLLGVLWQPADTIALYGEVHSRRGLTWNIAWTFPDWGRNPVTLSE